MRDQLKVQNVHKRIGAKTILYDVSFQAATGDLVVILGPNGAGKTTLLRLIAKLTPASAGTISFNGDPYEAKPGSLGYVSHKSMLYDTLSVLENMAFFAKLHGRFSPGRIKELLSWVDLWLYRHEPAAVLSRGMQQRLSLARTFLLEPRLILYDEPFTGLDEEGQELLRGVLKEKRQSCIQLLVTHEPNLLAGLDYRELRLKKGRVVGEGVGRR